MRRHHPIVRVTHWVNVLALTIMVGSGLRIFNAHPAFARVGERFCCNPWEGMAVPGWLTFGGWLAGARNWHFAMMWLLVLNGLVYVGFIWLHGEWRDLVPRRGDPRDAWEMIKYYLFARRDHPRQGKHNTLQKLAYFSMPLVGIVAVLTGIAIWKPVQLSPLTLLFGGYVWARYFHFLAMLALVVLTFGHIFMVLSVDPYSLRSMTTGGYDPALSPEERNARPFLHLLPRPPRPAVSEPEPEPEPEPVRKAVAPAPAPPVPAPEPEPEPEPAPVRKAVAPASALPVSEPELAPEPEPEPVRKAVATAPEDARNRTAAGQPDSAPSPVAALTRDRDGSDPAVAPDPPKRES